MATRYCSKSLPDAFNGSQGAGIIPTGWLTAPINITIACSMFGNKSMLACLIS